MEVLHFTPVPEYELPPGVAGHFAAKTPEMEENGFHPIGDYRVKRKEFFYARFFAGRDPQSYGELSVVRLFRPATIWGLAAALGGAGGLSSVLGSDLDGSLGASFTFPAVMLLLAAMAQAFGTTRTVSFLTVFDDRSYLETGNVGFPFSMLGLPVNKNLGRFHLRGLLRGSVAETYTSHLRMIQEIESSQNCKALTLGPEAVTKVALYGHKLQHAKYAENDALNRNSYDEVESIFDGTEWVRSAPIPPEGYS